MRSGDPTSLVRIAEPKVPAFSAPTTIFLALAAAALVVPTMSQVARDSWGTEQGGHGPLVLATGAWAIWRELKSAPFEFRLGKMSIGLPLLVLCLGVFAIARITGILEVEAFSMYLALITGVYLLLGGPLIRHIWFPLLYLAFALPPPDTVVAAVTQPIKIAISSWSVSLLGGLGYPVASSGVTIQIGQYQLLVAAACAGLNSIVTLTALCLFYTYLRHRSDPAAFLIVAVAAIPIAVISNLMRVIALVLITYYCGDAVAQGFVHGFAGLLMFSVALVTVFVIEQATAPFLSRRHKAAPQ